VNGNLASKDGDLVRRWCVAGKGLVVKSCLDMAEDLLSDRPLSVMPEFTPEPTELWIICPSRQSIAPAVRLLRNIFREKTKGILTQLVEKDVLNETVLSDYE